MRLCRYKRTSGGPVLTGVLLRDAVVDAHSACAELAAIAAPGDVLAVLQAPASVRDKLEQAATASAGEPLDSVRLLAPVPNPPKIICCWVNYLEDGATAPSENPIFFGKFNTTIIGPGETILLPRIADKIVVEPELTAVIGKSARHVSPAEALDHVCGYTIVNDVTAFSHRLIDLIGSRGPNMMAKTFDTFAPMGPAVTTPDEIGDPHNLRVRQWLNDELATEASTSQMVTRIPEFISYLSQFMTLEPGDLILTGSPKPLGKLRFLSPGDDVRIAIERVGTLSNPVAAE